MQHQFNYSKRNVAFIDILGFSEMVNSSQSDSSIFDDLFEALQLMQSMKNLVEGLDDVLKPQVTLFSDNIVISYLDNERDSLYNLILDCIFLYITLLAKGIYVRGGITTGLLYHDDTYVVGPALIKAYNIESKVAIYPRIIIDDNDYFSDIIGSVFKRDFDGLTYIDPIGNFDVISQALNISPYEVLSKIHSKLNEGNLEGNMGIIAKKLWLRNYCNRCFKKDGEKIITLNNPQYVITPNSVTLLDREDMT